MNEIKVSVIIPIYNVEKYIKECIESVQEQTLADIEIVCVDDGSADNSMEIIEKSAQDDNRIKIIYKMNGGLSSARNAGLEEAKGKYVLFLDSDDYILPETLEELYAQAEQYDLDCLYFDAQAFCDTDEAKEIHAGDIQYYKRGNDYRGIYKGMELFTQMQTKGDIKISACLQLSRKELLKDNEIVFYEGIIHEDILFYMQLAIISQKVMYKRKSYYMRRIRRHSIMTTKQEIKSAYGVYICMLEIIKLCTLKEISRYNTIIIEDFLLSLQLVGMNKLQQRIMRQELSSVEIFKTLADCPCQYVMGMIVWLYGAESIREKELEQVTTENRLLANSLSYRVGLAVTFVPRRVFYFIKYFRRKLYQLKCKAVQGRKSVSIIIPVYNAGKYLKGCLESLCRQTLNNIQIICVNDGSTDNSLEILKEFEQKDNRVIVVNQNNQGAGAARNNGMLYAKGEYLLFLDADDYFSNRLCELTYYEAKRARAQICLFRTEQENMLNGEREPMSYVFCDNEIPRNVFSALSISQKIFQITTSCPWSKLFERRFIEENQIKFQNIKNANDVLFVRTACALADRITSVREEPLVTYRRNYGLSLQGSKSKAPLEFFKALKELKEQLNSKNLYSVFEKSFINMVLSDCIYNYNTANSLEAREIVRKALTEEIFAYFGLEKYDKSYFYNYKNFEEYREIMGGLLLSKERQDGEN